MSPVCETVIDFGSYECVSHLFGPSVVNVMLNMMCVDMV